MNSVFGDPCRGARKVRSARLVCPPARDGSLLQELRIRYVTLERAGSFEIAVPGLGAPIGMVIRLGWSPM